MSFPIANNSEHSSKWLSAQNIYNHKKNAGNAKVISVTGGKGGVGKTTTAITIAQALSDQGFKTLLIDFDSNLSNTSLKLGIKINDNFIKFFRGEISFENAVVRFRNLDILPGCNGNIDLFKKINEKTSQIEKWIVGIFGLVESRYDFIILDTPSGVGLDHLSLNAYADFRFVVVNPDKSSLTDSYSLVKILNKEMGVNHFHLIANKIENEIQYKNLVGAFSQTVDQFLNCRLEILGEVYKQSASGDIFDELFLQSANNALYKDITKIINKFSDNLRGNKLDKFNWQGSEEICQY